MVNEDGRALLLKYMFGGFTQHQLLTRSCYLGYNKSFDAAKFNLSKLTEAQRDVVLFSASSLLGSSAGMLNLGYYLEEGIGIEKDKKASIEYYLRSLEEGYLYGYLKKRVDTYFDEDGDFRLAHPNYQKWNKSYD